MSMADAFIVSRVPLPDMQIAIFHNILWSKYKGGVFSAVHDLAQRRGITVSFTQIAETEGDRVALGSVDLSYHQYPYELVFSGAYDQVPVLRRVWALAKRAWAVESDLTIIPGYDRVEYWAMLLVLMLRGRQRGVFCDSTARDRSRTPLKELAKRAFFSRCDVFFCYGQRSRDYILSYGVDEHKVSFRCQAAALPHTYSEKQAREMRVSSAAGAELQPQFLYVGRLSPEKGLDTLLLAMSQLVRTHPGARLVIAGGGPIRAKLEAMTAQLGLGLNVKFAGSMGIDALAQQYAAATALVLPSTSEPWGLVVNESLSYGCPVVVSDACGCVPELVVEGVTGFVFQPGNANELAARLDEALETFAARDSTADACIAHMRLYTPERAAAQIIIGASNVLGLIARDKPA